MIFACAACGLRHPEKVLECWYCGVNNSIIKMTEKMALEIEEKYNRIKNNIPRIFEDRDWEKERKDLFG